MAKMHKFFLMTVLICTIFIFGCNSNSKSNIFGKKKSVKELKTTPAERTKARLLRKIDRDFDNPDAHFKLGEMYQEEGLWSQAEYEFNTSLSFDPAHKGAQAAMVKVLAGNANEAKSKLYADIYMNQASSSAEASLLLALAFQKQQLDEHALGCYRQALHLAPNSAKINRQIGYYYLAKTDKVRAQEYLSRSFQLNPNQPEVAGQLGRLGVAVKIPRKTRRSTKRLDRIVEKSDKEIAR